MAAHTKVERRPGAWIDQRRRARQQEWLIRRRRVRRRLAALVAAAVLAPVLYSYVSTMLKPSSLPLGIRSIEWLRANGGAGIVNEAERLYYQWTAPGKGGPALRALPTLGADRAAARVGPPRIQPSILPSLPGEGIWRGTGRRVAGEPPILVTTYRPDPSYPRTVAFIGWIDHARTQLALYPGRYEPPGASPRGPMSVPSGQRWRLLATFNSGFTFHDGHGGFALNGRTYTPLQKGVATVIGYRDGRVDVRTWRGGRTAGPDVQLARQNLPLIVVGGQKNRRLSEGPEWGATLGNAIRVWRSGVGIDRHGNLLYAAADHQTVASLADIFIHAGAVRAMELDINAEWPSFITYGRGGVHDPRKLVPNAQQPATRYLVPDDRDFFAVYRAIPGSASPVPLR